MVATSTSPRHTSPCLPNLSLTTGAGIAINAPVTMAVDKSLTANALGTTNGTINLATSESDLSATGTGAITLTTNRDIRLGIASNIVTESGSTNLAANQDGLASGGVIDAGIWIAGATIRSAAGDVSLSRTQCPH